MIHLLPSIGPPYILVLTPMNRYILTEIVSVVVREGSPKLCMIRITSNILTCCPLTDKKEVDFYIFDKKIAICVELYCEIISWGCEGKNSQSVIATNNSSIACHPLHKYTSKRILILEIKKSRATCQKLLRSCEVSGRYLDTNQLQLAWSWINDDNGECYILDSRVRNCRF